MYGRRCKPWSDACSASSDLGRSTLFAKAYLSQNIGVITLFHNSERIQFCGCVFGSILFTVKIIPRVERKTGVSQMVVFPQTLSPHHEGVMKITTFLSVNNENLGAIAGMSNGT